MQEDRRSLATDDQNDGWQGWFRVLTVDDKEIGVSWWCQYRDQHRNQVLCEKPRKRGIEWLVARKERRIRENTLTSQLLDD